jgi:hypothetical protein
LKVPSFARAFGMLAGLGAALLTTARAQPLPHVELSWQGPVDCASAEDVLAHADAQLGPGHEPATPLRVVVVIAARDDGALVLQWSARGENMSAKRTMTLSSCAEARQAAALLIAMALAPDGPAAAALDPERDPSAAPAQAPAPAPAPAPARDRSWLWLGLAPGLDLQALPGLMLVGSARVGVRWGASSLELDGFYGLPTTRRGNGAVELTTRLFAVGALGCHGAAFRPWQLDACFGLELVRAKVELQGADAGTKSWLRFAVEPRVSLRLVPELAVGLYARVVMAPEPADFSNAAQDRARAPVLGLLPLLGITWHPL